LEQEPEAFGEYVSVNFFYESGSVEDWQGGVEVLEFFNDQGQSIRFLREELDRSTREYTVQGSIFPARD
jgi:hypothetical protein